MAHIPTVNLEWDDAKDLSNKREQALYRSYMDQTK